MTPIAWPNIFISGPPLLPEEMGVEVCIIRLLSLVLNPETTPVDTINSKPSGLPIVNTDVPFIGSAIDKGINGKVAFFVSRMNSAISAALFILVIFFILYFLPERSFIKANLASSNTWSAVSPVPFLSIKNPVPVVEERPNSSKVSI